MLVLINIVREAAQERHWSGFDSHVGMALP